MIFAVMIFAININQIFKVIDEYSVASNRMFHTKIAINRFMKSKGVPNELSQRVRQYLNEHWYEEGNRDLDLEKQTIQTLAPELREELMLSSYGQFLTQNIMFSQNFSRNFLKELALSIEEVAFAQGEIIFNDQHQDMNIYYIQSGSILIHPFLQGKDPESTYINKLKQGEIFGEYGFFTGNPRTASAVANSYTQVYRISRLNFISCLQNFREDYEVYCSIRDQLMIQKSLYPIGTSCWTCGKRDHYSTYCTVTHYRPSVQQVLDLDLLDDIKQGRKKFERFKTPRWHTVVQSKKLIKYKRSNGRLASVLKQKQDEIIKIQNQQGRSQMLQSQSLRKQESIQFSQQPPQSNNYASEYLELQRQFASNQLASIHAGLGDFDKPTSFTRYYPEGNVSNVWTQNGELKKTKKKKASVNYIMQ